MPTVLERFAEILIAPVDDRSPALAHHLLDTLGAWVAAGRTEDSALLQQLVSADAAQLPALDASLLDTLALRVALIRNTEIDDIHMESCVTAGSVVVPVALTLVAAQKHPRAQDFARSLAAGYEAMTRLSLAVAGATILYRGVWPTFFAAPVGAAAVASALLGADAARTADALAIALTLTSGAAGGHSGGASPRWILLGQAARAGVFAALAAMKGYHGDRTLLDGDWLQRTHGVAADIAALVAPRAGAGVVAKLSYKPYCSAKQGMAALDGFRQLLEDASPHEIAAVRVTVPPSYAGMIGHRHAAKGRVERITSCAYQLALAAYWPNMLDDVVRPDLTDDADVRGFMPRVEVAADPALAEYFPRLYPARVEITLGSGRSLSKLVTDAKGDPGRPLTEAELRAKFHRLADPVSGGANATNLAAAALAATSDDGALATLSSLVEMAGVTK